LRRIRTDQFMHIDLSGPIWTIEDVGAALHLEVDSAREYTYLESFPRHWISPTRPPISSTVALCPPRSASSSTIRRAGQSLLAAARRHPLAEPDV